MSADGQPACHHTRILTDPARKRNRKDVFGNYNKTRINIGHQHDRWMELKEALRVQTRVINDAGRQAVHKNKQNTRFILMF